ncbi:MAG TPA: O-acetyl-ADP-ribose deacetylase [Geothrix sp.]|uniref:O-acetyl-ADP-ribose deacetylase n=1 Tax=Geothrix mesophila TaxID=2922723 RepID=UPI001FACABDB|nr:O-acetyl-ADP-ribose deacetylase [Geothrix sp. SG198]HJV38143.1 O-acetyl-ADP-ribose deacetylase [Geothrix sp.]
MTEARLRVVQADITTLAVDAIVNAANSSLLGGGGVDGAIHRAAGPGLLEECQAIRNRQGGCRTGRAVITGGHRLPATFVIHTVGPVWQDGDSGEDDLLASCYHESLRLAEAQGCRTVAFPAISTGIYGFPADRAAGIAIRVCREWLAAHDLPQTITLVAFDGPALAILQPALKKEA